MKQATRTESAFERDFRKALIKLLTVATSAPKTVDELLFGNADDRTEEESEIRPYFYGSGTFGIVATVFCYIIIGG